MFTPCHMNSYQFFGVPVSRGGSRPMAVVASALGLGPKAHKDPLEKPPKMQRDRGLRPISGGPTRGVVPSMVPPLLVSVVVVNLDMCGCVFVYMKVHLG